MLEIRELSAGYPEKEVLRDLTLSFPDGSLTAIVGPNGCGKSTMLKALAGILPCSGDITFQGSSLKALPAGELAKILAFLPQSRPLPEITAGKLVLHGRFPYLSYPRRYREEDRAAAHRAMEQMGILSLENRYLPTLSGGERQKVYIAMVLAQGASVILMDEPTSYLDISHKFEVMQLARQLADSGKTVILVLHDLDLAMNFADRIAVMDQGRVLGCDRPERIYEAGLPEQVFGIRMGLANTPDGPQYYFLPQR